MIAYLDASVVLRLVLGEPGHLREWDVVEHAVASALTEVECLRTLDRLGRQGKLTPAQLAERRAATYSLIGAVDVVEMSPAVLRRASEPFPTPLGTLDAIHLAAAVAWRDARGPITFATHDQALAQAARAVGFPVVGE